jgi:hypothetical protein
MAIGLFAQAPDFHGSYTIPLTDNALKYQDPPELDPVARLQERIDSGKATLEWDEKFGYLPAVLKALKVLVSSQGLVFSKTSFQLAKISPETPRAIYFNDNVYVGYVQEGDVIEVSSVDPERGGMFYTVSQTRAKNVRFERRFECLQCHSSPSTTGMPGHLVRSVYSDPQGYPMTNIGSFVTDHRSDFRERWGGWYVSGTHGSARHMGNVVSRDSKKPEVIDREAGANLTVLPKAIDLSRYLDKNSDIAALMVLEHQTKMHNLITRAGFEVRSAMLLQAEMNKTLKQAPENISESNLRRIYNAAEILVRYAMFADEPPLESPVRGVSAFTREFAAQGPKDKQGRGLREFDLQKRLFKYPFSYVVYSEAFDKLPEVLRERFWMRVEEVLSGKDKSPAFARISDADRANVREILQTTFTAR